VSFVKNIGIDGSGTHCGSTKYYNTEFLNYYKPVPLMDIQDSIKARKAFAKYFSAMQNKSILKLFIHRVATKLYSLFKK
jgi:hypothetical protein